MSSSFTVKGKISAREIAFLSLFAAMMEAGKTVMAPLPNIEPVSLLLIVCTCVCGLKALYPACVFVLLEGLLHGFGMWFVSYIYVWPALVVAVSICRKTESRIFWALLSGIYGLLFGALCAIPYLFIGGWKAAAAYWTAGVYFDLLHGLGNFALTFALFPACVKVFRRFYKKPSESGIE